jgi:hypothetical protein
MAVERTGWPDDPITEFFDNGINSSTCGHPLLFNIGKR